MCEPASIAIAATVIGGVVTAYGQVQQGKAAEDQANYQAAIQRNNAIRADQLSADTLLRGEEAEKQQRLKGRLLTGQMRAVLASSGQTVGEGSAGELVVDQAGINELDALNVRASARREAEGFQMQGSNLRSEATLTKFAGEQAASNAKIAATGTLLTTGGSVASQWYQFNKAGVKPFGAS